MLSFFRFTRNALIQSYRTFVFLWKRLECFLGVTDASKLVLFGFGLQSYVLRKDVDVFEV